jgi:hypothetical protein
MGFEEIWLKKFEDSFNQIAGPDIRARVMDFQEDAAANSNVSESIRWTAQAMARLDELVDEQHRRDIMTACACEFPATRLIPVQETYAKTNDLAEAHRMLETMFHTDLEESVKLDEAAIREIKDRAWGVAGTLKADRIVAVKMPFELQEYLGTEEAAGKRYHYCHCPRVREVIRTGEAEISQTYCYCGAGFYKRIWEIITQDPVRVEVLETVLHGDDECKIAIYPSVFTRRMK